jgi:hypothetical protein
VSLIVLAAINAAAISVKAQGTATVNLETTTGGSTSPAPGTLTFNDGETVTIQATADQYFDFQEWILTSSEGSATFTDNPLVFPATGGVTYNVQAVFVPFIIPTSPIDISTAAIVVVLTSAGGTTNPTPGIYALKDATNLQLTAVPNDGWEFSRWVISGFPIDIGHGGDPFTGSRTENPYTVDHGYGNRYAYQAVFTPVGGAEPTPTPTPGGDGGSIGGMSTNTIIIIALVVVIIIILIAFGVFAMRKKK